MRVLTLNDGLYWPASEVQTQASKDLASGHGAAAEQLCQAFERIESLPCEKDLHFDLKSQPNGLGFESARQG